MIRRRIHLDNVITPHDNSRVKRRITYQKRLAAAHDTTRALLSWWGDGVVQWYYALYQIIQDFARVSRF